MSKLQKKKPSSEKSKRRAGSDKGAGSLEQVAVPKGQATPSALKAKADKGAVETKAGSQNIIARAAEFLREVKVELKKVTWPTRKQTTGTTIVVIVFVFVVAAFLGVFDYSLSKLVQVVLT